MRSYRIDRITSIGARSRTLRVSRRVRCEMSRHRLGLTTRLLHPETETNDPYKAVSPPLYQTATFDQPSATEMGPYDYTRSGNPTRTLLEDQITDLEGATRSFAFSSGMAALSAVCKLLKSGEDILAGDDLYGGSSRLLERVVPNSGVRVFHVDTTDLNQIANCLKSNSIRLVMLESPTNPRMQVCDIQEICKLAHAAGAIVCVDNSILTAVFCQPLALGADITMTSATKFISGHSDVTAGLLAIKDPELAAKIYFLQNAEGAILGPFDCWLCLRGIKTLSLRMEKQVENCKKLVSFLDGHPLVKSLHYPGLETDLGFEINKKQAKNGGSLFSFTTNSVDASRTIASETSLFKITVSFGSVVSLISMPCFMSHASISAEVRKERGLPDDLIRISAGERAPV
eukprot:g5589.t1